MLLGELRKSFFLATQRPPFVAAYRAAYEAALRLVTSRIAFRRGVAAVYLTSGMLDEPVYGLSDIDLTVIACDERARGHLTNLLAQLRLVAPMLGPIEQQAVWTRGELDARLAGSPFVEYRLLGPRPRRLLLGDDVLAGRVATAPRARQGMAEIRFAWEVVRPVIAGERRADAGHLARKALADVTRAALWALGEHAPAARAACLERARAWTEVPRLDAAIAPRELFRALHDVVAALAARLPVEDATRELRIEGPLAEGANAPSLWLDAAIEDRPPCATPRRHVVIDAVPDDATLARWSAERGITVELGDASWPFGADSPFGVALRPLHPEMFGAARVSTARLAFHARLCAARKAAIAQMIDSRAIFRHDAESLRVLACVAGEAEDRVPASVEAEPPGEAPELLARLASRLGRDPGIAPAARPTMAVLICTRNRAPLLRAALESICAQRRAADEVVVLDNGSTDDTRDVVESFRARLPVKYGHLERPNIPAARNAAIALASAEILCFIDDDATADPGWLAGFEETFRGDPAIGVVGGSIWPARAQRGALADFHRWMQSS